MSDEYRVVVTGGRDCTDTGLCAEAFDAVIRACNRRGLKMVLIHGAARGADIMAATYCSIQGVECRAYPAKWEEHGRGAGHIRNQQMIDEGMPHVCIAFDGGRGTANMVERCDKAGIFVIKAINAPGAFQ